MDELDNALIAAGFPTTLGDNVFLTFTRGSYEYRLWCYTEHFSLCGEQAYARLSAKKLWGDQLLSVRHLGEDRWSVLTEGRDGKSVATAIYGVAAPVPDTSFVAALTAAGIPSVRPGATFRFDALDGSEMMVGRIQAVVISDGVLELHVNVDYFRDSPLVSISYYSDRGWFAQLRGDTAELFRALAEMPDEGEGDASTASADTLIKQFITGRIVRGVLQVF